MKDSQQKTDKRGTLRAIIKPKLLKLLDRAAELEGKSRRAFILDAARQAAEEIILDSSPVPLKPRVWKAFAIRMDAEPSPNGKLTRTMRGKAPWER